MSCDTDKQLLREANLEASPNFHHYVAVIFDECKIKEDLVYNKHTGELIGYTNLTDINNHLQQSCKDGSPPLEHELATHMLVFFVCGLFSSLKFPYAQFSTKTLTGDTIFPIFWSVVERLELIGFKVLAVVCDGVASNRRFFKVHGNKDTYKIDNPYSESNCPLFFISDVPHLLKTTRNSWANSNGHLHTRKLWVS